MNPCYISIRTAIVAWEVVELMRVETGAGSRSASSLQCDYCMKFWDSHYFKFDLLSEKSSESYQGIQDRVRREERVRLVG